MKTAANDTLLMVSILGIYGMLCDVTYVQKGTIWKCRIVYCMEGYRMEVLYSVLYGRVPYGSVV